MPQIPSRLPRWHESPSPDHRTRYTGVVHTVLRYSNVFHLHQRVCHEVDDTMVRTSRFTFLIFSCLQYIFTIWSFARRPQFFVVGRTVTNLSLLFGVCPACQLLQSFSTVLPAEISAGLPLTSLRRVSSSNLQFDISYRSTSSQFHRTLP